MQARSAARSGRRVSGSASKGDTMGRSGPQVFTPSPHTPGEVTGGSPVGRPHPVEAYDMACQTDQVLSPSLTVHDWLFINCMSNRRPVAKFSFYFSFIIRGKSVSCCFGWLRHFGVYQPIRC